jgi:hypothetical protein
MSTSPAARMLTGPVWLSMNESIVTEPAIDAMDNELPVNSCPVAGHHWR